MTIETLFNKGDKVILIENDKITSFPVKDISYKSGTITYSFVKSKACTSMDEDTIIYRDEKNCFKSIDELANFYKNDKNR